MAGHPYLTYTSSDRDVHRLVSTKIFMNRVADICILLTPCLLLFNHLTFLRPGGLEISVAYLVVSIFMACNALIVGPKINRYIFIILISITLLIVYKMATQFGTQINSVALIFIAMCAMSGALVLSANTDHELKRRVATIVVGVAVFHGLFLILQSAMFNGPGNFSLLNPLGPLSPMGPRSHGGFYDPHDGKAILRPNGLFSEPYAASLFQLLGAVHYAGYNFAKKYLPLLIIILLGTMATMSMAGILGGMVVAAYIALVQYKLRVSLGIQILIATVAVSFLAYTAVFTFEDRLHEFSDPKQSGYIRITAPILLIFYAMVEMPIGLPIGDLTVAQTLSFWPRGELGDSIDNGLFALMVFFGWPGIFFLGECIRLSVKYARRAPPSIIFLVLIWLGLFFNGGIWGPKAMSLTCFLIIMMPKSKEDSIANN
ncbi:MAG: hypothetical protein AAGC73_00975 [Verrucomicrobiota bacterium]